MSTTLSPGTYAPAAGTIVTITVTAAFSETLTTVGPTTVTVPNTGVYSFYAIGAGGGGANIGYGGGGGEYAFISKSLSAGQELTVNVPAGGIGAAAGSSPVAGSPGGDAWVALGASAAESAAFIVAKGGKGGPGQSTTAGSGGLGGTGGTGSTLFNGGPGGSSTVEDGNTGYTDSG